jgi:hypothetical protein
MNESFRNAVRIEDSNIVGLVPGGFREAIPMMIVEGRPVLPLMGTSNPTLILEAKAPGETSVTVRLGRKTVTYDVLVTGDEEALDQP